MEKKLEFNSIFSEFRPKILHYLKRLVGEYAAEDLTQEVFIKVNEALKSFRGESKLSTWLYRIATNTALDKIRSDSFKRVIQKSSKPNSSAQVDMDIESKDIWTGERPASPDSELIQKEMNDCLRNFIEQLPDDYRTVIILSELEGLKNIQIADILEITLETVKIRLHRARITLKKKLERHCNLYYHEGNELACDLKARFEDIREE